MLAVCLVGCLAVLFPWLDLTFVHLPVEMSESRGKLKINGSDDWPGILASSTFAVLGLLLIAVPFRKRMPLLLACLMVLLSIVPLIATMTFKSHVLQYPELLAITSQDDQPSVPAPKAETLAEAAEDIEWTSFPAAQAPSARVLESEFESGFYLSLSSAIAMLVCSAVAIRHAWLAPSSIASDSQGAANVVMGGRDWITLTKQQVENDEIPNVCMVCGESTEIRVNRTFQWAPDWAGMLTMAGGIPGFIALATTTREFRIACPVCSRHRDHWSRFGWVCGAGWLVVLLIAATGCLAGWALDTDRLVLRIAGASVCGGVALAVWIVIMVRMGTTRVRAAKITKDSIRFERVSQAFARAANRNASTK